MSNCIWVCSNYHVGPDQLADAAIFQPKCATPTVSAFRNAVNLGCKTVGGPLLDHTHCSAAGWPS